MLREAGLWIVAIRSILNPSSLANPVCVEGVGLVQPPQLLSGENQCLLKDNQHQAFLTQHVSPRRVHHQSDISLLFVFG
jgi:hypothetical protein